MKVRLSLLPALVATACSAAPPPPQPSSGPVVLVANQQQGVATVVELGRGRVVAQIDVGMDPHEGAATPDGRLVALVSPASWFGSASKVAIVDLGAGTLARTLDLGSHRWLHGVAFVDNRTLLVSSRNSGAAVMVDVVDGQVRSTADNGGSRPYLLHLALATQKFYMSNPASNTVTELDLPSRRLVRTFPIADGPAGFAVSPDGKTLWVATWVEEGDGAVSVLDLAAGSVAARLGGFRRPRRLAFTADGSRVVVTDADHLRVLDAASRQELGRVHLGDDAGASGVACAPQSSLCYVALMRAGVLGEIDVAGLSVRRRFEVGRGADGVVYASR